MITVMSRKVLEDLEAYLDRGDKFIASPDRCYAMKTEVHRALGCEEYLRDRLKQLVGEAALMVENGTAPMRSDPLHYMDMDALKQDAGMRYISNPLFHHWVQLAANHVADGLEDICRRE